METHFKEQKKRFFLKLYFLCNPKGLETKERHSLESYPKHMSSSSGRLKYSLNSGLDSHLDNIHPQNARI